MLKKLLTLILLLFFVTGPLGCKESEEPAMSEGDVKTAQEMKEEADQEITEENMDEELNKLEQEIDSDTGSEP